MKPSLIFLSRGLKAIAVVGIALALTACAAPTISLSSSTPSTGGARTSASIRFSQGASGVTGDVMSVSGNTFDVQVPGQNGPYTLVKLTSNTRIVKQATSTLSSVAVGSSVSATGSESNGVLTATAVRLLGQAGQGKRAGGPPANGTPRAGGVFQRSGNGNRSGGQANGGTNVFGTVQQVSADGLTVKAANGTTTQVKLAPKAQVTTEETATTSDITTGETVTVVGNTQNGTVTATLVQVMPAAQ